MLTIGHSNHAPEPFLDLLRQYGIQAVADVRSAPYSRYAPHFGRERLAALLEQARIAYLWFGETLGGRPDDPACYHDGIVKPGNVDYAAIARQPWYQAGLEKLLAEAAQRTVVIMCSEEDPRRCHRHRLIERSLRERGVRVEHIRGDGHMEFLPPDEPHPAEVPSPQLTLAGFAA